MDPATEWIWTPEPTHTALVNRETWDAAQQMGRRHGNARDPETPTTRPGRRYPLRSRLFCSICHRRMAGTSRTTGSGRLPYYRCPHDPGIPRHTAAYPDHRHVWVREEPLMAAIARFFTERVFGPDRAAMLDATLPATAAAQAARDAARASTLRKKLDRIDVAETALISELEATPKGCPNQPSPPTGSGSAPGSPTCTPNAPPCRPSSTPSPHPLMNRPSDPALLDKLPTLGDIVTGAPPALIERLLAVFDLSAVYNRDKHQLTIHATITDATPQAVRDLLTDPRADHNQRQASDPGPTGHDQVSHLTRPPGLGRASARGRWAGNGCLAATLVVFAGSTAGSFTALTEAVQGVADAAEFFAGDLFDVGGLVGRQRPAPAARGDRRSLLQLAQLPGRQRHAGEGGDRRRRRGRPLDQRLVTHRDELLGRQAAAQPGGQPDRPPPAHRGLGGQRQAGPDVPVLLRFPPRRRGWETRSRGWRSSA